MDICSVFEHFYYTPYSQEIDYQNNAAGTSMAINWKKIKMKPDLLRFRKDSKMREFLKSPEAFMIFILLIVLLLEISSFFDIGVYGAVKTVSKQQVHCPFRQKIHRVANVQNYSDERKNSLLPMI